MLCNHLEYVWTVLLGITHTDSPLYCWAEKLMRYFRKLPSDFKSTIMQYSGSFNTEQVIIIQLFLSKPLLLRHINHLEYILQ